MSDTPVVPARKREPLRIQIERGGLPWDRLTAVAAIAIAAASLFISYRSFHLTSAAREADQEYRRLSARPRLFPDDIKVYKEWNNEDFRGLVVLNAGIGAAQIVAAKYFCNGVEIRGDVESATVGFMQEVGKLTRDNAEPATHFLFPGAFIPVGHEQPLFGFRNNRDVWHNLVETRKHCGIRLEYQSVYKEGFVFTWGEIPVVSDTKNRR